MATKKALIITALGGFFRSFLTNDIRTLQSMGYEVICAANNNHPGSEGLPEYYQSLNVRSVQIDFSSNKPLSKETLIAYKQIKSLLREEQFELIHCHTAIPGVICRWLARGQRRIGCKVVYTTHGFYFHNGSGWKSWLIYRTVENLMSFFGDAIITINHEDFANAKKMHSPKVFYINGVGVDTSRFTDVEINRNEYRKSIGVEKDDIVVLAVGELSRRKNHKVVVEAISKIGDPNLVMVHCGNAMNGDATTEELKVLIERLGVRVNFLGLRKDIPEICQCADIGTISSTREGLGLAGIEMLASGLPVVGSRTHGILDYIKDGEDGFLANPYSVEEFASGIQKLMDSVERKTLGERGVKIAKCFDISLSREQMKKIYSELLS